MPRVAEPQPLPVAQARGGDPAAWRVLFTRYQLPLYAFIFEMVRNEQASMDIVQETFAGAVRYIGGLRDDAKFASWLFGIAHQKCLLHFRKQHRDVWSDEELADAPDDDAEWPGDALLRREQAEEVRRRLEQLPPPQRAVLLLHFIEDFSLEEIAAATGVPVGTVKSRLHYAKRALRQLMEDNAP